MQVQRSLIAFCLTTDHISQVRLMQFVVYGSILLITMMMMAWELYLVGHVHMTADIFSQAAGHPHAASLAPRLVEGPPDIAPLSEGPPDIPVLPVA